MRIFGCSALLLVLSVALWQMGGFDSAVQAQGRANDPNVLMLDNCSDTDGGYDAFGGCPKATIQAQGRTAATFQSSSSLRCSSVSSRREAKSSATILAE